MDKDLKSEDLVSEGETALALLAKAQSAGVNLDDAFDDLESTQEDSKKQTPKDDSDDDDDKDDTEDDSSTVPSATPEAAMPPKPAMAKAEDGEYTDATEVLNNIDARLAKAESLLLASVEREDRLFKAISTLTQKVEAQTAGVAFLAKAQQSVLNPSFVAKADMKFTVPVPNIQTARSDEATFQKAMEAATDPYVARRIEMDYNAGNEFLRHLTPEQRQSAGL